MINYIWLDSEATILDQVKKQFYSAAILFNPFIKMPNSWDDNNNKNYPTHEEILKHGKPYSWDEVLKLSGLNSYAELVIALKSSIGALKSEYGNIKFAEILDKSIKKNIYFPNEDKISEFFLKDLIRIMGQNGATEICYHDPIMGNTGCIELKGLCALDICFLYQSEVIIYDTNRDYAFMSIFGSFITLLLCKKDRAIEVAKKAGWGAIECSQNMSIDWYCQEYKN